jgi:hypothetical protein
MNAWREIIARIFTDFEAQDNVSPAWLVNPATRRRLKLDKYFPDAGIAIRFTGLKAKGQKRQSDWEALETDQRDQTRSELCRINGVQLAVINPNEDPIKQLDALISTLSRSSRSLAQGDRSAADKNRWMPVLSEARSTAGELRARINKNPEQMIANLAESWRDRETGMVSALEDDQSTQQTTAPVSAGNVDYQTGLRVHHSYFGDGVITEMNGNGGERMVEVLFDAEPQRTFLVSLVQDKMSVVVG